MGCECTLFIKCCILFSWMKWSSNVFLCDLQLLTRFCWIESEYAQFQVCRNKRKIAVVVLFCFDKNTENNKEDINVDSLWLMSPYWEVGYWTQMTYRANPIWQLKHCIPSWVVQGWTEALGNQDTLLIRYILFSEQIDLISEDLNFVPFRISWAIRY